MRKPWKQLALVGIATLMASTASVGVARAAFGPGEAFGFVWTEWGAAESTETVSITAKKGKSLVTQRYIIQPGWDGLWPTHQGPQSIMIVEGGGLQAYEGCGSEMKAWETGKAYYRESPTPRARSPRSSPPISTSTLTTTSTLSPGGVRRTSGRRAPSPT
jgi:hypothetical protein